MHAAFYLVLLFSILELIEINRHNKTVNNMWPESNEEHTRIRLRMQMQYIAPVIQIIILSYFVIGDIISLFR